MGDEGVGTGWRRKCGRVEWTNLKTFPNKGEEKERWLGQVEEDLKDYRASRTRGTDWG